MTVDVKVRLAKLVDDVGVEPAVLSVLLVLDEVVVLLEAPFPVEVVDVELDSLSPVSTLYHDI